MNDDNEKNGIESSEDSNGEEIKVTMSSPVPWDGTRAGWDPILGLETIRNTMVELMSEIFYQPGKSPFDLPWAPHLDMYMDKGSLFIDISLPGVTRKDIQIHATSDLLIIRGDTPGPHNLNPEQFFMRERRTGKFSRSVPLPFEVVPERIRAHFRDGLLNVKIPMKPEKPTGSVRIEIE